MEKSIKEIVLYQDLYNLINLNNFEEPELFKFNGMLDGKEKTFNCKIIKNKNPVFRNKKYSFYIGTFIIVNSPTKKELILRITKKLKKYKFTENKIKKIKTVLQKDIFDLELEDFNIFGKKIYEKIESLKIDKELKEKIKNDVVDKIGSIKNIKAKIDKIVDVDTKELINSTYQLVLTVNSHKVKIDLGNGNEKTIEKDNLGEIVVGFSAEEYKYFLKINKKRELIPFIYDKLQNNGNLIYNDIIEINYSYDVCLLFKNGGYISKYDTGRKITIINNKK